MAELSTDQMPFVMWIGENDEDYTALFPAAPGGAPAVKIMSEQFLVDTAVQRAQFGEQPMWMTIALAAVLGQIGLAGAGFGLGYAQD